MSTSPGKTVLACSEAIRRAVKEMRVEVAIPGIGAVRVDYINRQRFVHVDGYITSMRQLMQDAEAVDAGLPTQTQVMTLALKGIKS